jgi:hypothetical protein
MPTVYFSLVVNLSVQLSVVWFTFKQVILLLLLVTTQPILISGFSVCFSSSMEDLWYSEKTKDLLRNLKSSKLKQNLKLKTMKVLSTMDRFIQKVNQRWKMLGWELPATKEQNPTISDQKEVSWTKIATQPTEWNKLVNKRVDWLSKEISQWWSQAALEKKKWIKLHLADRKLRYLLLLQKGFWPTTCQVEMLLNIALIQWKWWWKVLAKIWNSQLSARLTKIISKALCLEKVNSTNE